MSSTSASEREISEGSSSPLSYVRESPHSSPSQQVSHITNNLTGLTCSERNFPIMVNGRQPQLCIIEQAQNHFRFRYVSEMIGTHGCLLGTTTGKTKTHPTVELLNYSGRALIRCRLAQCDSEEEHPHRLLEDDQDRDVSQVVPQHNSYRVSFAGMGIIHTAKKDVPSLLVKKYSERLKSKTYNQKELRTQCENMAKKINLNIVRLKFSAHDVDSGAEICEPVFSEPIHNMKSAATNDLKICRISQHSGRPRGQEDVFILVEKVNKKNIIIRFVELDENGEEVWSENGSFLQSDVHHQYAIVFRTPPYKNPETPVDVKVYIELARPSDGRTSDRKVFTYKAEQVYKQIKKRKNNSYSSIDSSSGGSITNEIPTTVLNENITGTTGDAEMPLFTIKPLIPTGSPGHCGLGSALGTSVNPISAMYTPNSLASPNGISPSHGLSPIHGISPNHAISPSYVMNSPHMAMDGTLMDTSVNVTAANVMTTQQTPMWSGVNIDAKPANTSIPNFSLHSAEFDAIINQDAPPEDQITPFMSEYINIIRNTMPEEQTEENNSFTDLFRSSSGMVSDSGRVKTEPQSPSSSSSHSDHRSNKTTSDDKGAESDYDAYYELRDGLEVKQLVQDLCGVIRLRKGYKNQEVRSKLERLFEIRLSNGDTFLHTTLRSNQVSFEAIVKVISSVNMPHLLNYGNHKNLTVLHSAIIHGNAKIINLLVCKGCNPMLRDSEEDTVVHYAVRYNSEMLEPLLTAIKKYFVKCDLNACNNEKQTALHLAALSDDCAAVRLLLSHGASRHVRDAAGRTPLHLAALDGKLRALRPLADLCPNIDALDGNGNTALQIVCSRNTTNCQDTVQMLEVLLEQRADPLAHEEHNESAWRLTRHNPDLRAVMAPFVTDPPLEDDVKSDPEDEFESADEDMPETGMPELDFYIRQLSQNLDANEGWLELAKRLNVDGLTNWFAKKPSPTAAVLEHVKESREYFTSKSLALMLEDMNQHVAARIVRGYLD